jgi:alanine racemase
MKAVSVFSHLAASEDSAQDEFTLTQFDRYNEAVAILQEKIGAGFIKHIANSAAIFRLPQLQMDMVRLGIGLYGVDSAGDHQQLLQSVATLRSTIAQIKVVKAGESVSYNRKAVMSKDSLIATVRIGYADGFSRRLGHGVGKILINKKLVPVVGTVCMDMIMVDVTDIQNVKEGDDVVIFGSDLPIQKVASWAGTIAYEVMTGISQRVKRVYFEE